MIATIFPKNNKFLRCIIRAAIIMMIMIYAKLTAISRSKFNMKKSEIHYYRLYMNIS